MNVNSRRGPLWVVTIVVIFGAALAAMLMIGGQTSTILSKVGAAVGPAAVGQAGVGDSNGNVVAGPDSGGTVPTVGTTSAGATAGTAVVVPPLLIVRTGSLDLEVTSIPEVLTAANDIVASFGGFVSESKESGAADSGVATAAYRIPAAAWDRTLSGLRRLATVRGQLVQTQEVTGAVVDLRARITNLRATEAALQAIMARASKISDVLDVQGQLTDTRGQIEELTAQQAHLEDRAAYGTLTVTYRLPPRPTPTPVVAKGWDPGDDVAQATDKLVRIGQGATSTGIWFAIVGVPVLVGGLVLAIVAWQAYRTTRWLVRRRDAVRDAAT